jgi:predicted deacylase
LLSEPTLAPLVIGGKLVEPGQRCSIELRVARLHDFTEQSMTVEVVRGKRPGPILLVTAAVHGDEIGGVEIIRRLLKSRAIRGLRGTLVAVPIVNVFGFNSHSRYLPDRRDLNRSFPGSETGSLAARMAHLLATEVLSVCTHAIDLHTGAVHRANLPQIRAHLEDPEVERLARAFHVPVVLNSNLRDGSLRESAVRLGIPMLLFEGGEALRFDEKVVKSGLRGILNVMRVLGMVEGRGASQLGDHEVFVAKSAHWVRAPQSGILRSKVELGWKVLAGRRLGIVSDPIGTHEEAVLATHDGIVIGMQRLPLVSRGDALVHVATFEDLELVTDSLEGFEETLLIPRSEFLD